MTAASKPPEPSIPRPRDLLEAPGSFGKRPDARWIVAPDTDRSLLSAAWLQHQAALVVRFEISSRRGGVAGFARSLGQSGDYVRRKLNGERWASVRDLAQWAVEVGPEILPEWRSVADLYPPPEFIVESP